MPHREIPVGESVDGKKAHTRRVQVSSATADASSAASTQTSPYVDPLGSWSTEGADAPFEDRLTELQKRVQGFTRDDLHPRSPAGMFQRHELGRVARLFSDEEVEQMDDRDRELVRLASRLTRKGENGYQMVHPESPQGIAFRSEMKRLIRDEV